MLICAVHFFLLIDLKKKNPHSTRGVEYKLPYMALLLSQRYIENKMHVNSTPTVFFPFPDIQTQGSVDLSPLFLGNAALRKVLHVNHFHHTVNSIQCVGEENLLF